MAIDTDPSTQQHAIVIVSIVAPIVTTLFVAIRLWTRTFVTHSVGYDDYTALITLLSCIGFSALVGLGTNHGIGWHTADLSPDRYVVYMKWIYVSSIVYLFALGLYKFTILILYLRLFGVNKKFRYATWAVMFLVFGYLFSNLMTLAFGCTPIDKYWNTTTPGHCAAEPQAGLAFGSLNFLSDVVIFVLPMPMVWRLQLSRESKLGVILVFMGGVMASVVAIVRYGFLIRRYVAADAVWYDGKNLLWMVLEVNTGLICSCTLAFKPFLRYFASRSIFKSIMGGLTSHSKNNKTYSKNNKTYERRNDSGPMVRQNTGGRGFTMLGDAGTEMDVSHPRAVEAGHNV